jgi:hypothetical protein
MNIGDLLSKVRQIGDKAPKPSGDENGPAAGKNKAAGK